MPKVSFYVLPTETTEKRYLFVCKLIEKAYREGIFAYVLTDSPQQSQTLDALLWTFRAGSFIPHQQYHGEVPDISSVFLIGHDKPPCNWTGSVINLSTNCPDNFKSIEHLLEIIDIDPTTRSSGRSRYRIYEQAGLNIVIHNI